MKFLKAALVATALTGFAASAQAQDSGAYINIGIDAVEFDAYNLSGKLGYNINEYFGVEGQAGFGISDEKIDDFKIGVDNTFGGFGVLRFPAGENFDIFARAGYHFTKFGASGFGESVSVNTDGFALGAGINYWFSEKDGLRLEYTYLDVNISDDDGDFEDEGGGGDVFTLSYARKF